MKLPYSEGTWFAVPLRKEGGFAVGLVARATKKGRVILCYFFGPYQTIPEIGELVDLNAQDAVLAVRVGDLNLLEGKWSVIGLVPTWRREQWPMPLFARHEIPGKRVWLVYHSDTDPNMTDREELSVLPIPDHIRHDSVYGADAAEVVLSKRMT